MTICETVDASRCFHDGDGMTTHTKQNFARDRFEMEFPMGAHTATVISSYVSGEHHGAHVTVLGGVIADLGLFYTPQTDDPMLTLIPCAVKCVQLAFRNAEIPFDTAEFMATLYKCLGVKP